MPFEDDYVDFALANAVIEHVGQESERSYPGIYGAPPLQPATQGLEPTYDEIR